MSISLEKGRTRQILGALLIWMVSAVVMALAADLLIGRLKLGSQCISIAAASILCLSSFAASLVMFHRANGGRKIMPMMLLWLVTASTLLMIGFLVNSDAMDLKGLIRVLASSLLGSFLGALIKKPGKKGTKVKKFVKVK